MRLDYRYRKTKKIKDCLQRLEVARKVVSFDFIKRRFIKVPDSTLHYDLRRLMEKALIKKLGSTRAVRYASR